MSSKALARGHIELRTDTPPTTPTAISTSAHQLFTEIRTIHKELRELDDLAPEEKTNGLLTRLVNLCIIPYDPRFTEYFITIDGVEELCVSLRSLCAVAEGELEKYWAAKILSASKFSGGTLTFVSTQA
jgi:nicotianamine synthase